MRIIRGSHRSRQLNLPGFFKARPTTDMAKEALFNVLENNYNFENIRVLDAFAGTGSISYEFASRGCNDVSTVEMNDRYSAYIKKVAKELTFNQINVYSVDFFKFVKFPLAPFDIIFADPPYDLENIRDIPLAIFESKLLNPNGWLIIEHSKETNFSAFAGFEKLRNYGKVNFSFFAG
jgi:16S rRNA (guanine(966)-N(2))-methyltransferase RsmD